MTREEAEKYAENMTYREAIYNLMQAKSVPYRKATFIKVYELLDELEREPVLDKIRAEIVKKHLSVMEKNDFESGRTYGYEEILEIIDKYKAESE